MQVRVSDWAWLPLEEFPADKLEVLKQRLTVQPRRTSIHQQVDPEPIELFRERNGHIGVPRGFFVQQNRRSGRSHEIIDGTSSGSHEVNLKFHGELKEDQGRALAAVLEDRDRGSHGGIIRAVPGWGKTVAGLGIWTAFGGTAIVLVQKQFLLDQWTERIKQFVPDARIGRIQGDKCEYGPDFDISVAMLQTLSSRANDYPDDFWDAFGFLLSDETHRVGAPSWASLVPMFTASYRLGLSATPRRKDGADDVFLLHLGGVVYKSREKRVIPRLRRIFTPFKPVKTRTFDLEKMSKEVQLRHICKHPGRNNLIVSEMMKAMDAGRKVIVLSERRKHLEILKEKFDEVKPEGRVADFYVGGRKQEELDEAEKADVLLGTYQMAKEALDIPSLDTVFLASPVSDVEQAVGRIMREYDGKKQPIVTDFIDENVTRMVKLWNTRRKFYIREGMWEDK